jgi:hypothetical protein
MMKSLFFVDVADLLHPERISEKEPRAQSREPRMTFVTARVRYFIAARFPNS